MHAASLLLWLTSLFLPGSLQGAIYGAQGGVYSGTAATAATYTYIGKQSGNAGSDGMSLTYSPTLGNLIVSGVLVTTPADTFTFSDNATGGSSTYAKAFTDNSVSGQTWALGYGIVKSGVTAITTAGTAGGSQTSMWLIELHPSVSRTNSTAFDLLSSIATNTGTAVACGTVATSQPSGALVGIQTTASGTPAISATGIYTNHAFDDSFRGFNELDAAFSSSGSYNATGTLAGSQTWSCYTASFK